VNPALLLSLALAVALAPVVFFFFRQNRALRQLARKADRVFAIVSSRPARKGDAAKISAALDATAEQLEEAARRVEAEDRRRRDFIANVSHELRTPLTAIQGYAETLIDDAATAPQQREFLEVIQKNVTRMSRLTADLLTLARLESPDPQLTFTSVSSSELLEDALTTFAQAGQARGIELAIETIAPRAVSADRDAIHQVFSNLIDNAIKYSRTGSRVAIGAREVDLAVEFYVRDLGTGVAIEHHARLFERFYRVDTARSRELGGTGLGLAIVKHIVLQHGGYLRLESAPGEGTAIFFSLPVSG
jgi:two-component system phosphate regulon sensor histidine kinase PhoR